MLSKGEMCGMQIISLLCPKGKASRPETSGQTQPVAGTQVPSHLMPDWGWLRRDSAQSYLACGSQQELATPPGLDRAHIIGTLAALINLLSTNIVIISSKNAKYSHKRFSLKDFIF